MLNYFINLESLKIRVSYLDKELEPFDTSGSCIKQKQR